MPVALHWVEERERLNGFVDSFQILGQVYCSRLQKGSWSSSHLSSVLPSSLRHERSSIDLAGLNMNSPEGEAHTPGTNVSQLSFLLRWWHVFKDLTITVLYFTELCTVSLHLTLTTAFRGSYAVTPAETHFPFKQAEHFRNWNKNNF